MDFLGLVVQAPAIAAAAASAGAAKMAFDKTQIQERKVVLKTKQPEKMSIKRVTPTSKM